MLDEYILERLAKLSAHREELNQKLNELFDEESLENGKIEKLLHSDDVGKEIFSPRGSNEPLKLQIMNIKRHVDEIMLQEAKIQDDLEKLATDEEKYREMLAESRSHLTEAGQQEKQSVSSEIEENSRNSQRHEELQIVLKKLDQCIQCSTSDPAKCTVQLTNLRYYVMALLSK